MICLRINYSSYKTINENVSIIFLVYTFLNCSLDCEQMSGPTELANKLSLIVSEKQFESASEFTADEQQLLMNSITKFIENLNQYPTDYNLSCSDIVNGLDLKCHPEGGFYRRFSWTQGKSKIFYLLPDGCVSSWHRLKGVRETWKWLYGGTLVLPQISNDFRWCGDVQLTQNKDVVITEGLNIPEKWGNWFGALLKEGDYSFVVCECTPPFEFSNFELANEKDVILFKVLNPARVETVELLTQNLPNRCC